MNNCASQNGLAVLTFLTAGYRQMGSGIGSKSQSKFRLRATLFATLLMVTPAIAWGQGPWYPPAQPAQQAGVSCNGPDCGGYVPLCSQCDAWSSRWLGGYAGVYYSGGAGVGVIDRTAGSDFSIDNGGSNIGGLVGYNFGSTPMSANSGWLWGAEIDLTGLGGSETKNDPTFGDVKIDGNWLASLQVRGGYAWGDTYLYATTGLAMSDMNAMASTANNDSVRGGWAYGVGIEQKINHAWSARLDAVGYSFGSRDVELGGSKRKVGIGVGQVRLGIMKRF